MKKNYFNLLKGLTFNSFKLDYRSHDYFIYILNFLVDERSRAMQWQKKCTKMAKKSEKSKKFSKKKCDTKNLLKQMNKLFKKKINLPSNSFLSI